MSIMTKFEHGMERVLVPVANKLNSQRHIAAIRDAFILVFPLIMAGSIITLINFAVLSPDGFIAKILFLGKIFPNLADAQAIFSPVMQGSTNIMAILIVFLVARNLAIFFKQDDLLCGLTAIGAFFIVYTPYTVVDNVTYMTIKFLGAQGLFVAIIVAIITGEVFSRLARSPRLMIKMPEQVPPAVARSFKVLIPVIIITILFTVINYLITLVAPEGLNDLVYTVIQAPLKDMGTNVFSVIIIGLVSNLLWVLGIHGPNTVAAIRDTIFTEPNLDNLSYVAQHGSAWGAPYPATWAGLNDGFANYGGSGMTLGLLIAIFIASRRADYRDIAKLSIAPGIFNINEPVIFGLPIVLNPIMVIPFIITPAINTLIGYFFITTKLIPPVAYQVPWTTPGPLIPFLGTGGNWLALLVGLLCLAVATVIYLPFVMVSNKIAASDAAMDANATASTEK
ncbi:PTS sugar transporter subunit IIC [Listeria ivanovii]|uniref:Permease IIC component n=3 Tax=Listeria ivanovii TaxID=1638 RepID=A0ABS1G2C3_LISIV|nr:PTS sugar transporter subunit IIC [Listeria ivanovii]EFR95575.1 PTS system, lactose/cellobiose family IIC component [Listeria ivanovii FSL F6-596]AIS61122.1 PTS cellobiose transporter subunit IIC [Listeria ivanovii subsp. londoniensis]AIS63935.1 PTS cellobiose transporter subunit IIC [Listeria ivanovii subsp. londoniensis]MBC2255386.1 PTS sugar transporter subunit IIC [Listeria ivanovii]MBK1961028.1 PTS sugar transporter subunit IIC [Listeria ivanovii subsp. londoniensis]